jgi:magnesium transporter
MITTFIEDQNLKYKWIDVLNPTSDEMQLIASEHGIHKTFIVDILQPEHLPKHEIVANTSFFILRYYAPDKHDTDTIQGLTNKIAIFQTDNLLLTIHLHEAQFLEDIRNSILKDEECPSSLHLLNRIVKSVLQAFEPAAADLGKEIDLYEEKTFLRKERKLSLSGVYHLKRKIDVNKKVLFLSRDIVERIDDPKHQNPDTRDTRDLYIRLLTLYESMSENTNQLLNVYFSISAQRTNEVIRVLTLFSVFFMPLTFIVGIYGMNFRFMPELNLKFGYPLVILFMLAVSAFIYLWFKRKGWL